jgi:hypothetical protein
MVPMRRSMPHAPIGTHPRQSPAFPLLLRHLHVLLLPDTMHSLEVHFPAAERIRPGQYTMRALAPMPRERLYDLPHHSKQLAVAVYLPGTVPLRAPVLTEHTTDPSFRDLFLPAGPPAGFHRTTATLGARQLSYATRACGRAASLRISMSRAWSATSFFSLEFSFWSS